MKSSKIKNSLATVDRFNYSMQFAGKMRTFEKVIITLINERESMSVAEFRRLSGIIREEVLFNENPLLIGEAQVLISLYRLKRDELVNQGLMNPKNIRERKSDWSKELPLGQSRAIKAYFKALPYGS